MNVTPSSRIEVIEDSQSSLKRHRDLFGEVIPIQCTNKQTSKCTPLAKENKTKSKRKIQSPEDLPMDDLINRPTRVFIPTPKIIKIMKDAQAELYSLMGLNNSSSDASMVLTDSLNISGVQNLQDSPKPTTHKEKKCETYSINNENDEKCPKENSQLFKGKSLLLTIN